MRLVKQSSDAVGLGLTSVFLCVSYPVSLEQKYCGGTAGLYTATISVVFVFALRGA